MDKFEKFFNQTMLNAQEIFSKKEKEAWRKFESVGEMKFEGKGSRLLKKLAIDAARETLKAELDAAEDEYARAVGAI